MSVQAEGSQVELIRRLDEAAAFLRARMGERRPEIAVVLGSGLGGLADAVGDAVVIPFADVPYMNPSTSFFHKGNFVCGTFAGKQVLVMQGRLHGYEGLSSEQVAFPMWLLHRLGVHTVLTSNAAGAINAEYAPGEFCVIADHINFTGRNPVASLDADALAPRFFSMKDCYDPALRRMALELAGELGVAVHEGVYLGLLGPSFETAAEIEAFRRWGADTVAMSVVEEVIAARHVGMRVFGISLISNMACGVCEGDPLHDFTTLGPLFDASSDDFQRLIAGMLERMQ